MTYFIFEGKAKDKYIAEAEKEFVKRISGFGKCELRVVESVVDAKIPEGVVVLLDELGETYNSLDFAKKFMKPRVEMGETLVFLIGGAFGPGDKFKEGKRKIRLSDMTFTHQMCRVLILEQVYRALCILKGKKYHY